MTDRIRHLTITLERDVREDDVESIVSAIQHVRGVASVEARVITHADDRAREVLRAELEKKLHKAVRLVFRRPLTADGINEVELGDDDVR